MCIVSWLIGFYFKTKRDGGQGGKIDEYNVSKMQGRSLFDGYIVMFSALLLCMPGHFPSTKKMEKVTNA